MTHQSRSSRDATEQMPPGEAINAEARALYCEGVRVIAAPLPRGIESLPGHIRLRYKKCQPGSETYTPRPADFVELVSLGAPAAPFITFYEGLNTTMRALVPQTDAQTTGQRLLKECVEAIGAFFRWLITPSPETEREFFKEKGEAALALDQADGHVRRARDERRLGRWSALRALASQPTRIA